jgi:type II secretory pathway pseudopilin PulG
MHRRRRGDDRGESLIELIFTVGIMGTAVVALLAGLATAIRISDIHRKQAAAGAQVRTFAEAVERAVNGSPTSYVDCALPGAYESVFAAESGYRRNAVEIWYWIPATAEWEDERVRCGPDSGVQRVTLEVRSDDGRAVESIDVIIRKPCRASDPACS